MFETVARVSSVNASYVTLLVKITTVTKVTNYLWQQFLYGLCLPLVSYCAEILRVEYLGALLLYLVPLYITVVTSASRLSGP